ncbi:hypothetical protein [Phaeacidiphilus oryzae]|uniref:hypothetical protein n=1 Tax=Phaeacidiphilus oryzae TaxID=348818 RepID=UPI0009FE0EFB|nr:hypothetical protein [Phaeacidiphilus oryzae]
MTDSPPRGVLLERRSAAADAGTAAPPPAYRQALEFLADRARTVPGRLRVLGALLVLLTLLFGALAAIQISQSRAAADRVVNHSQPLSDDAAQLYHSLADADTTAATAFLQAGNETAAVRDRYNQDITTAATLLAQSAERSTGSGTSQNQIRLLNAQLPVYTGLVEEARADNRQGLPLGGAYLRYASAQMQQTMLPEAQKLYAAETAALRSDYADARALPWAAIVFGVLALAALVWSQVRLFRRTNRVFNIGLVTGTAALAVGLLWVVVAQLLAGIYLGDSDRKGAAPIQVLSQARIAALQCRGAENLNLVARGSTDSYEQTWTQVAAQLNGGNGWLPQASRMTSADAEAKSAVASAEKWFGTWQQRHDAAKAANDSGSYDTAVADTIGNASAGGSGSSATTATTDAAFAALDAKLETAIAEERSTFASSADDGRNAVTGLAVGSAVLAVVAAAAAVLGIGRRLSEYR